MEGAVARGRRLEAAGYEIRVIDVEVPYEVSRDRIEQRWAQGREKYFSGGDALGGRWVPSEYAREVFFTSETVSRPERNAEALAREVGAVSRFQRWRTTQEAENAARAAGEWGAAPVLEASWARAHPFSKLTEVATSARPDPDLAQRLAATFTDRQRRRGPSRSDGQER